MKSPDDVTEQIAKLLASSGGIAQLEKLLGSTEFEKLNLPREKTYIPRPQRTLRLLPDYALHVSHVCLLCDREWDELFHMRYNPEQRIHKGKKFQPGEGGTIAVRNGSVTVSSRIDPNAESCETNKQTQTFPLEKQTSQHQTCGECSPRLSLLDVPTLVGKLIRRAARIGETEDAVKVLARLTERRDARDQARALAADEKEQQKQKENEK